ncbi:hypothetical protein EXIGLDRAFT_736969 [Exidia glandulosa HHB12029]|uniref:RING-14 protein n=1 Tax=Exidia glandulosa HHB12029 TaxID=1314781 RepID=A0A166ARG7_EXIGL|nr:hypothetical protein EXIGLDRAFT_736969 [Exidia glandulosa HHB12029]
MHFGKSFEELLRTLPDEYQKQAIDYKKLKKLIRAVVVELNAAGLSPDLLHQLLDAQSAKGKERALGERPGELHPSKVLYELSRESDALVPHLKIWLPSVHHGSPEARITEESSGSSPDETPKLVDAAQLHSETRHRRSGSLLWTLQHTRASRESLAADAWAGQLDDEKDPTLVPLPPSPTEDIEEGAKAVDVAIPADQAFFALLSQMVAQISQLQKQLSNDFTSDVQGLSNVVSSAARPVSEKGGSDLYAWREIFALWVESEVFESTSERTRGERPLAEAEDRLGDFARQVTKRGLGDGRTLKRAESRAAVEKFLELNLFVLNLKKFERANADAARKILKKHAKRTALPTPTLSDSALIMLPRYEPATSLAHTLLLALTETLLPVLPSVEDYTCLICTSIAFRPIRLDCSHLFCVRCLAKMQKAGEANCPLCRAPTVLHASRANLDMALQNFLQDWFPREVREKAKSNDREAAQEEMEELGLDTRTCIVQ